MGTVRLTGELTCARYDIPVPARGDWARMAAGKKVAKAELPFPARAELKIEFKVKDAEGAAEPPPSEEHPLVAFERDPANAIAVRDDLPTSPL